MQSNKFEIKRGMVFNLNEPGRMQKNVSVDAVRKSRPYMVLSNNAVNNTGSYIHVAPMTSQIKDEKYYRVQLPHAESWVNISDIMLIPRQMCNQSNLNGYLSALSMNDAFFETLNKAIMRHFSIPEYPIVSTPTEYPVEAESTPDTEQVVPKIADAVTNSVINLPISITISIPGYAEQSMTLSPDGVSASDTKESNPVESVESVESTEQTEPLTPELVGKLYKQFGGTMTYQQIADKYHVSLSHAYTLGQRWKRIQADMASSQKKPVKTAKAKESKASTATKTKNHPTNYVYITDDQIKQCRVLGGNKSNKQVAQELNCSPRTISARIHEYREAHPDNIASEGVSSTKASSSSANRKVSGGRAMIYIEDSILKKTTSFGGKLSVAELSRILNVNQSTIYRRIADIKSGVTGNCKLSDEEIRKYIITHGEMFNGSMTTIAMSKALNMRIHNVEGYIARIRKSGYANTTDDKKQEKPVSGSDKSHPRYKFMTLDVKKQFVADCNSGKFSVAQLLAKYGSYGISSSGHLIKILRRMEKELSVKK